MDLIEKKPWLLYLLLFFLPPAGLFFMFKLKKFNKPVRVVLSFVCAFIFMIELAIPLTDIEPSDSGKDTSAVVARVDDTKKPDEAIPEDEGGQADKSIPAEDANKADVAAVAAIASAQLQSAPVNGNLKVHFIDVGQADSILIQSPDGTSVLVDAGNNEDGNKIVSYLKAQGVKDLTAVVATHPHEDHIGGMDTVIKSFSVKQVYMPNASATTKTFEDMIAAINASGAKRIQAKAGVVLDVPGLFGVFLAPNGSSYDDLNNYSAVLRLTYGGTSFLLTGDAENISEIEMLKNGNLQATLLKVGHHGSSSSTTDTFLKAVSPKYAVISVGKGNTYGHPTDETINRLTSAGVSIYRTDQSGTIIATSDGTSIKLDKVASPIKANAPPEPAPSSPQTQVPTPSAPPVPSGGSIQISSIDLSGEIVTIKNTGSTSVDLTGWKLISEEGSQAFNFPAGTSISAGGTLQILSGSGAQIGPNQLLWGKANIWNNKGDTGALYDAQGALVSRK